MSKKTRTTKATPSIRATGIAPDQEPPIRITQSFSPKIYRAISAYRNDVGLASDQVVVQLAVSSFLVREGYLERSAS